MYENVTVCLRVLMILLLIVCSVALGGHLQAYLHDESQFCFRRDAHGDKEKEDDSLRYERDLVNETDLGRLRASWKVEYLL